VNVKIK